MGGFGPLNYYFVTVGIFGLALLVSYVAGSCDDTLAIFGYNLFGESLQKAPCGAGAHLFLRFLEGAWLGTGLMFTALGVAPKAGVPVSKSIYAIVYLTFFLPMFLGFVLSFMVTEVVPGGDGCYN